MEGTWGYSTINSSGHPVEETLFQGIDSPIQHKVLIVLTFCYEMREKLLMMENCVTHAVSAAVHDC